jgi:hypothetical protein
MKRLRLSSFATFALAAVVLDAQGATTRVFSSYLGGPGGEFWVDSRVAGAAIAPDGTLLVVGDTSDAPFGTTVKDLRSGGGGVRDIFVARISADGSTLIKVTFLGGNGRDDRASLAVAADGSVVVSARTLSTNLATSTGAPQGTAGGGTDAFVAVLNPALEAVTYLTYLGGSGDDTPSDTALDAAAIVVTGTTASSNFPVVGTGVQGGFGGGSDAFVTRINRSTGQVTMSTYLGGSGAETGAAVGVAADGTILTAGSTQSPDFPVVAGAAPARHGASDVFFAAIDPASGARLLSTFFGGTGTSTIETATGLAIAADGSVRISGMTDATDFPVNTTVQPVHGGMVDGFVAAAGWSAGTLAFEWVTYLGGAGNDAAFGVAVDAYGTTWVTGGTQSATFPPNVSAFDAALDGTQDSFVAALSPLGSQFMGTSYFGGTGFDTGLRITVDAQGDAYLLGQTTSTVLATGNANGGAAFDASFNGQEDAFVLRVSIDADNDGLPDIWEQENGLSTTDASGDNGASGDPDGDDLTNAQEYASGGTPMEATRYFAEGATGLSLGFATRFAILNPHPTATTDITFDFLTKTRQQFTHTLTGLGPGQRATLDVSQLQAIPELANAEFSTVVRSKHAVVADRTMTWNATGYGSHSETATESPARTWFLAEGATHSDFDLFYLMQNPGDTPARVRVTYLRPAPKTPLQKTYEIAARSRENVWVNLERFPDENGAELLDNEEVSALIEVIDGPEIIVERAMYHSRPGRPGFDAGHNSVGVTSTATSWFLAEGATGAFFDLFVLIANPTTQDAQVQATYLLETGQSLTKTYSVAAQTRRTVWVDNEDAALQNAAVSTIVTSTNGVGIIVERAMWWPGPAIATWTEAHNSPGVTQTGTAWAIAEGESGGSANWETYVLIANTSAFDGMARVTLHYEDGTTETAQVPLTASSRRTVAVGSQPEFTGEQGRRYGVIVESLGANGGSPPQIVVERAMYSSDPGRAFQNDFDPTMPYWSAGTNAVATRLR